MSKKQENFVKEGEVINVDVGETLIADSIKCNKSLCFGMTEEGPICNIYSSSDVGRVVKGCINMGYPTDFIFVNMETMRGCLYIMPTTATKNVALMVEEKCIDGKWQIQLSKANIVSKNSLSQVLNPEQE